MEIFHWYELLVWQAWLSFSNNIRNIYQINNFLGAVMILSIKSYKLLFRRLVPNIM